MISPALTISAQKHLTYLKELNRRTTPSQQQREDIRKHAEELRKAAEEIAREAEIA